jgi:hypothetical protein
MVVINDYRFAVYEEQQRNKCVENSKQNLFQPALHRPTDA